MAFLKIISPEAPERSVELEPKNTLGRHPDNTIQILDRIVSKNHCHIDLSDGRYVLRDLGSLNGTYINGERVSGQRELEAGDEITLGSTKIVFDAPVPAHASTNLGTTDKAPGRVTMSVNAVESHVRAKLAQQVEQNFVPERLLTDATVLRRDYEKLRVSFEL